MLWTTVCILRPANDQKGKTSADLKTLGDQICGVGLSVRFNSHLITIWHRDSSKQKSIDGILQSVLSELPPELTPKPDNYFYKRHCDHPGFEPPPELKAVLDSHNARVAAEKAAAEKAVPTPIPEETDGAHGTNGSAQSVLAEPQAA